jgi:tetratricopeptide (TPR) repeat protein
MTLAARLSLVVLVLSIVTADRAALAYMDDPGTLIDSFLRDYQEAFEIGNPFLLREYDPGWAVFQPLLHSTWFDHVARSSVELGERQIKPLDQEEGRYQVSFVKSQEDLQHDGMFTRGIAGIRMEVGIREGRLTVVSHRTFAPGVAVEGFQSSDPRSWGEEHSQVERYLFRGLEYLRDGDMKSAEDQISRALDLVDQGNIPKFLMGPAYFMAMCHYYGAMLDFKEGDFLGAAEGLREALLLNPEFPAALNLQASILFAEAEYEKAHELWQRSLAIHSDQAMVKEVVTLLASVFGQKREKTRSLLLSLVNLPPSQAVQVLAPAVKRRPRSKVLVPLLAKAYLASGDPEKGLEVLTSSKLVGKEVEISYLAARLHLKLQQPEEALDLFEKAWESDREYRDSSVFIVCLYAANDQFREALAHLGGLGDSPSGAAFVHALKGKYNLMAGNFLDAVSELEQATSGKLPAKVRTEVAYMLQRIIRQRR